VNLNLFFRLTKRSSYIIIRITGKEIDKMTSEKGINSYRLKLIALVFMVIDHIYTYLNAPLHGYQTDGNWPQWIPLFTRFVSPLFLYLMIKGFYHTRSRRKYLTRLLTAGLIMMGGNVLINYLFGSVDHATGKYSFHSLTQGHDIFLTLAAMFVLIWCLDNIKHRKNMGISISLAIITGLVSLILEGGFYMLPVTLIIWFFYNSKPLQCLGIGIWCLILLAHTLISYFTNDPGCSLYSYLCFDNEWAMFSVIFFILPYNGKRGRNTVFTKYMFYVIYPVHLWILMILRYIIEAKLS